MPLLQPAKLKIKTYIIIINPQDLNREVIKSEFAVIRIIELDFEMPRNKKSIINTVEGFITNFIEDLSFGIEERKVPFHL